MNPAAAPQPVHESGSSTSAVPGMLFQAEGIGGKAVSNKEWPASSKVTFFLGDSGGGPSGR